MNMRSFKLLAITLLLFMGSCKRETNVTFGVEEANLYEDKALKTKSKNEAVYISVLYTNLYQTPISPSQLYKTQAVITRLAIAMWRTRWCSATISTPRA